MSKRLKYGRSYMCIWMEFQSHFCSFLLNQCDKHFSTDLRERGLSYSGRRKYTEVERATEKNEKRELGKREGALG